MHFYEDNETCSLAIRTGKTVSLKHLNRTHRVDIAWLHERLNDEAFVLHDCESSKMRADIFTKPFTDKGKWAHACEQIAHVTFDTRNTLEQRAASSTSRGATVAKINNNKGSNAAAASNASNAATNNTSTHSTVPKCLIAPTYPKRTLIEFCCGPESRLGQTEHIKQATGCTVMSPPPGG